MGKKSDATSDAQQQPARTYSVALVFGDIADTAWRMFVPTIGLTIVGLYADKKFHTIPILLICGIALGSLIAALLVRNQLKRIQS